MGDAGSLHRKPLRFRVLLSARRDKTKEREGHGERETLFPSVRRTESPRGPKAQESKGLAPD
jgi:hypothetical protein